MGCDIHLEVFTRTTDGEYIRVAKPPEWLWLDEMDLEDQHPGYSSWPEYRSYAAFGKLCDGIRGHSGPFVARGLPKWVEKKNYSNYPYYGNWDGELDLGEHSFSWLTLDELRSIDWYWDDEEGDTFELWPSRLLIPLLEKVERIGNIEEVIVVFGFDS